MTAIEIKKEIKKALEQIPENRLSDILKLIKEVKSENLKPSLKINLEKILSEDNELLKKLAE